MTAPLVSDSPEPPVAAAVVEPDRRSGHERRGRWRPSHGWRSRDILRATLLVLVLYWVLNLLWFANPLVLASFLGVLFGLAVSAGVDHLQSRLRIPRAVGAFVIVFGFLGLLAGFFAWSGPALAAQSRELRTRLPQVLDQIDDWLARNSDSMVGGLILGEAAVVVPDSVAGAPSPATPDAPAAGGVTRGAGDTAAAMETRSSSLRARIVSQLGGVTRYLFPFLSSTVAVAAGVLLVIFLAIYVAVEPRTYHTGLMHLFPHDARERAGEVLSAVAIVLRRWLVTQLVAMVVIGTVTTVVLLLLDVPAALPLGVLAGLLEFIPTVGPILSAVPAIAMGFVVSPEKALWVAIAYWGIQFLENQLLIPLLMREGVDIPPALTILAQALMALVFGFLGLLVAVPLLAASMVAVKMLYVEGVVGDDIEVFDAGDQ
ncbi:MAG: AI-2E family transporter [Gemmatimonadaceae bacterium]